jgi:hypothetical protein
MRKLHECHSEPQAKNLVFPATCEGEILRLSPQDDIVTQSATGEERGEGALIFCPLTLTLSRQGGCVAIRPEPFDALRANG